MLRAEFDEEEQLFNIRLEEWSIDRLKREGYALDGMTASVRYQPRSKSGHIVTFSRTGKTVTPLPFNRFTYALLPCIAARAYDCRIGSSVVLSRTDPMVDRVRVNGTLGAEGRPLRGQVYSATRLYVRVEFSEEVHKISEGLWR